MKMQSTMDRISLDYVSCTHASLHRELPLEKRALDTHARRQVAYTNSIYLLRVNPPKFLPIKACPKMWMSMNIMYNLLFVTRPMTHYSGSAMAYHKAHKDIEEAEMKRASSRYC